MTPPNERSSRRHRREHKQREAQMPPNYPPPPFQAPQQGMSGGPSGPGVPPGPPPGWQGQPGPMGGYQVRHQGGFNQSASTAYARPPQFAQPPVQGGPNMRSAPEAAYSAPDAGDNPGVIRSSVAAQIEEDPRSFVRVTILYEDRRGDLLLPGNIALAEILPSLVRKFTTMTPRSVTRGYVLVGVDGTSLGPGKSLFEHRVTDGTVLTLTSRVKERDKKYDDIVEAVADAAEELNKPWTAQHTATTAVASTAVLVIVALLLLIQLRPDVGVTIPIITGVLSALHVGLAWVLQRMGRAWHAVTIALLATVAAGVTGMTAIEAPLIELPAVFGGLAAVLVAGLTMPLLKEWREILAVPMVVGAVIAIMGGLYIAFDIEIPKVGVTIAGLVGVALLTVPLLAMRMSGLDRDRAQVNTKETKKLYTRGHRLMIAFWVSCTLTLLIVAIPTIQIGRYGVAVMALTTLLLVMGSRRSFARIDVFVQYLGALAVFVLTAAAIVLTYPSWWPFVIVAMLLVIVVTAAFGLIMGRTWTWTRRVGDVVEIFAVVLLIPATVLALELW